MILNKIKRDKKQMVILIDPDKENNDSLLKFCKKLNKIPVDYLFVGGSLLQKNIDETINILKKNSDLPIILFPGSLLQISDNADAILLLSLISGRNPDFLIGNHVIAANFLKRSKLEILPTAYLLIESGNITSVEYISNTKPIPRNKIDIAVATAIAGEILGLKLIYLEAGSGAKKSVNLKMIEEVKKNISIPLIVGGGIKSRNKIDKIYKAGADIVVIGTALEKNKNFFS